MNKIIRLTIATICIILAFLMPSSLAKPHEIGIAPYIAVKPIRGLEISSYKPISKLSIIPITPLQYVQSEASKYGWDQGYQWEALQQLISNESDLRPAAQNPTSTAYGIFQFLDSTWGSYGCVKTSSPAQQSVCGLRYIKDRYGSPSAALAFWKAQSPHWY